MIKIIPVMFMWLFASFYGFSLPAEEAEGPLVVKLATESSLDPLYLLPMTAEQSELSDAAVRQLEQILAFDLNHNGATFVARRTAENDQYGQSGALNQLGSASRLERAEHLLRRQTSNSGAEACHRHARCPKTVVKKR